MPGIAHFIKEKNIRLDLTKKENMLFFVCSEVVESTLVKLESSRTVIPPPAVSLL